MPVDDESQVGFSISQGKLPWQPNFVRFSACRCMQTASGEGGGLTLGFALHLVFLYFLSFLVPHAACF